MSLMNVLILAPFATSALERLRRRASVVYQSWLESRRLYDPEELVERLNHDKASALVVEADFVMEETMSAAQGLRFVGVCRNSVSQVDVGAATARGILVVNTPGRNSAAVAEHTLGLMLAIARHIPRSHQAIVSGKWDDPLSAYVDYRGTELAGKTAGLVGFGGIGREVAKRLLALGMRVIAYDPLVKPEAARALGVTLVDLDTLVHEADFVSLHAPDIAETEGTLSAKRITAMKRTAYLINTASAALVDNEALARALREHRIAGAALDVHESHPLPPTSPFLSLDNVVLTPHIGGATAETVERHSRLMADDLERFMDGLRPLHLVNPSVWKNGG